MTENTFYLVTQIPDSVVWGGIGIVAIAGANPLKEMEPNLKRLNGYFYSLRWSENYVSFHSNGLQNCKSKEGFSVRSFDSRSIEKVDEFMLGRLREKHPEMNVYRFQ